VLELGKSGSAGSEKGVIPVLRDGAVVATFRASNWKESATAVIGSREWVFAKHRGELTGRWAAEPDGAVRLRARQASWWRGSWILELEGATVEAQSASWWSGTHRYTAGGRQVAESGNTGGWSPRSTLTVDPSMLLAHQVFVLWLELLIRRRSTAAAGAATAGGAAAATS
jgi:hypothetical protein